MAAFGVALSGGAARHAAPVAHQRVLPRRRQGADEQLLRRRRAARHRRALRRRGHAASTLRDGAFESATVRVGRRRARAARDAPSSSPPAASRRTSTGCARPGATRRDNFIVRGTPYNTGTIAARCCSTPAPQPSATRASATPSPSTRRAPKFDGGIVTRLDCVPLGIVVNRARRAVLRRRRGRLAEALRDLGQARRAPARTDRLLDRRREGARRVHAVGVSADRGGVDSRARGAARPAGRAARGDGRGVQSRRAAGHVRSRRRSTTAAPTGSRPTKSHWAQRLDTPPYCGLSAAARHHVHVSRRARRRATRACSPTNGAPFENVYAAGEIMAGNVLRKGYIAGIGMTIGTVFGRIAGESAARHASAMS